METFPQVAEWIYRFPIGEVVSTMLAEVHIICNTLWGAVKSLIISFICLVRTSKHDRH